MNWYVINNTNNPFIKDLLIHANGKIKSKNALLQNYHKPKKMMNFISFNRMKLTKNQNPQKGLEYKNET